jgi:hypothetical protein
MKDGISGAWAILQLSFLIGMLMMLFKAGIGYARDSVN